MPAQLPQRLQQPLAGRSIARKDCCKCDNSLSPGLLGEVGALADSRELDKRSDVAVLVDEEIAPESNDAARRLDRINGCAEHHLGPDRVKSKFEIRNDAEIAAA